MKIKLLITSFILATAILSQSSESTAASSTVRISQVYGGGGNIGSVYKNDFVELFNASASSVNLAGWSVQYAAAAGTSWKCVNLNGSISSGSYYLIQLEAGSAGTTALPTPDLTDSSINMSATEGKVALVSSTTVLSGSCFTGNPIVDLVGYGSAATCFEIAPAPAPSNTNSIMRKGNGCIDTGDNSADFEAVVAAPRNSFSVSNVCANVGFDETSDQFIPRIWSNHNNLFVDFTFVKSVNVRIEVIDLLGQLLSDDICNTNCIYSKAITNAASDCLIVKVKNEDRVIIKKLILLR